VSLLDNGPHVIEVWPMVWHDDIDGYGTGGYKPADDPVKVEGCSVQPVSSSERAELGQGVNTLVRAIVRKAPAGPWAKVRHAGRMWSVVGEPAIYDGSPATAHVDVVLKADRPAVPAGGA
jgi:hypothetical protein